MPVGAIYERYAAQSAALKEYGANVGEANVEASQRLWMTPDLGDGDITTPGLALAYDRSEIAEAYADILTQSNGSVGDAMAAKLQSDYLAAQERAYRLRRTTPIRACVHAAARRAAHGNQAGGVFARVDSYVQDLIVAGAAGYPAE